MLPTATSLTCVNCATGDERDLVFAVVALQSNSARLIHSAWAWGWLGCCGPLTEKGGPIEIWVPRFWSPLRSLSLMGVLEWTGSDHLRHAKFAGLREDEDARTVIKEHGGEG